jgi:hypothetical protein
MPPLLMLLAIRFEFRIGRRHSWPFKFDLAGDAATTDTIGHSISIFELAGDKGSTTDTMGNSNFELAGDATTTDTIGYSIRISNQQETRSLLLILLAIQIRFGSRRHHY